MTLIFIQFQVLKLRILRGKSPKYPHELLVTLNEGYYLLNFPRVEFGTEEECEHEEAMYKSHGWEKPGANAHPKIDKGQIH